MDYPDTRLPAISDTRMGIRGVLCPVWGRVAAEDDRANFGGDPFHCATHKMLYLDFGLHPSHRWRRRVRATSNARARCAGQQTFF